MLISILKHARRLGAVLLTCALGVGAWCGYLQLYGNLHTVVAGEVYRSAQPTAAALTAYEKLYNIKSVINLRGENDGSDWYKSEVATAKELGIRHYDFRMSARQELSPERIRELTKLMRDAPKPLLIHCKSGADRTGLASVIYLNRLAGKSDEMAEGQLSIFYGHFSIPYLSQAYAMDKSWEAYEKVIGLSQVASSEEPPAVLQELEGFGLLTIR